MRKPTRDAACCDDFLHATKSGTDAEGYGPAVWRDPDGCGSFLLATVDLPPAKFCPWCGGAWPNPAAEWPDIGSTTDA